VAGILKSHPVALTIAAVAAVATALQLGLADPPLRPPQGPGDLPRWLIVPPNPWLLLTAVIAILTAWSVLGSSRPASSRKPGPGRDESNRQGSPYLTPAELAEAMQLGLRGGGATADRDVLDPPDPRTLSLQPGRIEQVRTKLARRLVLAQRLAVASPDDPDCQQELLQSYSKLGDWAQLNGDLDEADRQFRAGLAFAEDLTVADPSRSAWQRWVMTGHIRLGDAALAAGDRPRAWRHFEAALPIAAARAAADPDEPMWQQCLSMCLKQAGSRALATGDTKLARDHYEASLAIVEAQAAAHPDDAEWQHGLAVIYNSLGQLAFAEEDRSEAARRFRRGESVMAALAERCPDEPRYARELVLLRRNVKLASG
jgi:tetratricopeptide (TPR) repeat protein